MIDMRQNDRHDEYTPVRVAFIPFVWLRLRPALKNVRAALFGGAR